MRNGNKLVGRVAAVASLVFMISWADTASGSIVTFQYNDPFSYSDVPAGASPWLTAIFNDSDVAGTVTLTLEGTNLPGGEFVSGWYFNLDPNLDPTLLNISAPVKTGAFADPSISLGVNAFKANGDGLYDILLSFATGGGSSNRFGNGESAVFTISGIPSLTATSFNVWSYPDGGHGPFLSAAHIQGIGEGSAWVSPTQSIIIPEPSSAALVAWGMVCGLGGLALRRRFKHVAV